MSFDSITTAAEWDAAAEAGRLDYLMTQAGLRAFGSLPMAGKRVLCVIKRGPAFEAAKMGWESDPKPAPTPSPPPVKSICYDPETTHFAMRLHGELVGFARCYSEADATLDTLIAELRREAA